MSYLNRVRKSTMALVLATSLAIPASAAWCQMTPEHTQTTVAGPENLEAFDMDVAQKISRAWAEDEDASGAVAFQENAEIVMSEGRTEEARHYFQAAEEELGRLHPTTVTAQSMQ